MQKHWKAMGIIGWAAPQPQHCAPVQIQGLWVIELHLLRGNVDNVDLGKIVGIAGRLKKLDCRWLQMTADSRWLQMTANDCRWLLGRGMPSVGRVCPTILNICPNLSCSVYPLNCSQGSCMISLDRYEKYNWSAPWCRDHRDPLTNWSIKYGIDIQYLPDNVSTPGNWEGSKKATSMIIQTCWGMREISWRESLLIMVLNLAPKCRAMDRNLPMLPMPHIFETFCWDTSTSGVIGPVACVTCSRWCPQFHSCWETMRNYFQNVRDMRTQWIKSHV